MWGGTTTVAAQFISICCLNCRRGSLIGEKEEEEWRIRYICGEERRRRIKQLERAGWERVGFSSLHKCVYSSLAAREKTENKSVSEIRRRHMRESD